MNAMRRLQIANRIHLLLLRELGQGIAVDRLLNDALYARDVLLVCDAHPGTDLAALARQFRAAADADEHAPVSAWGGAPSGFDSAPAAAPDSNLELAPGLPQRPARRHWLSPGHWLGR